MYARKSTWLAMNKKEKKDAAKRSESLFDARTNFFDLRIVRRTIYTLSVTAFTCMAIIIYTSELHLDLTYKGFNNFVEIFKVPISIFALNIPLVAILAAFHKSEQTRVQIRLSESQNVFANYYKHREEFIKHIEGYKHKSNNFTCDSKRLYNKIYPNSMSGDYSIDDKVVVNLNLYFDRLIKPKDFFLPIEHDDSFPNKISNLLNYSREKLDIRYDYFYASGIDFSISYSLLHDVEGEFCKAIGIWSLQLDYYDFVRHILSFDSSSKMESEFLNFLNDSRLEYFKNLRDEFFYTSSDGLVLNERFKGVSIPLIYDFFVEIFNSDLSTR